MGGGQNNVRTDKKVRASLSVSTNFTSGGGTATIIQTEPVIVRVRPHNEGVGGWSQTWWHFLVDGFVPGEEITLQLESDDERLSGISPIVYFSYDQHVWGLTNTGEEARVDGRELYVYRHTVRGTKVWFAYDLPYTPEDVEGILIRKGRKHPEVEVFELCKTRQNRTVHALRIGGAGKNAEAKHGIWLQARAHAFESGASWVLHELTLWLLSADPEAKALRAAAQIMVVPIVDVDGVVEGRSGKYQKPYDHWMNWHEDEHYWPEIRTIKAMLSDLAKQNMVDMFIDFHGPGSLTHPYFIVPDADSLPGEKQRVNREKFFAVLGGGRMDEKAKMTQSMTRIHYSPRPLNSSEPNSGEWVSLQTTDHNVAMTIEVNMNTHLSTQDGYRAEGRVLGRAISKYFTGNNHLK